MGADQIKERLHLRIEQADEKMLQVLGELADFPELGPEEASLKDLGA